MRACAELRVAGQQPQPASQQLAKPRVRCLSCRTAHLRSADLGPSTGDFGGFGAAASLGAAISAGGATSLDTVPGLRGVRLLVESGASVPFFFRGDGDAGVES